MAGRIAGKINRLGRLVPEGLLVDAAWLSRKGYSTSLRSQYVAAGWIERPARQVYRRGRGALNWQQAVISLQSLLDHNLVVGGRTALELLGFAHYIARQAKTVHLYGPAKPPNWIKRLPIHTAFEYHNSGRLFLHAPEKPSSGGDPSAAVRLPRDLIAQPWGPWGWQVILSSPERALLEVLDELPRRETFHQVDKLFEGLATLSPRRLQHLLADCRSVKVKRLFFFFADRHRHAWLKHINRKAVDLGKGKRMLVRGGRLNAEYQITVPADLDAG